MPIKQLLLAFAASFSIVAAKELDRSPIALTDANPGLLETALTYANQLNQELLATALKEANPSQLPALPVLPALPNSALNAALGGLLEFNPIGKGKGKNNGGKGGKHGKGGAKGKAGSKGGVKGMAHGKGKGVFSFF